MKTKISAIQLFASIIIVPYGSAALFFLPPEAKQDAWIAMLIYIIPAVVLQIVYIYLWNKYPEDTIVTYMPKIFGKAVGYTISVLYIIFFAYEAARVLRDFASLIEISVMPNISLYIIAICIMAVVMYATYQGMENLARSAHVLLYLFVSLFIILLIFLFTTPDALTLSNLKPVLENGIADVTSKSWKLITFPYGESILLAMLYPSVVESEKVRKAALLGVTVEGILLSLHMIMYVSVLGVDFASTSLFPFIQTIRIMNVGETFDRLDIVTILFLITGGAIKISFFMYGAMLGTSELVNLKDPGKLAVPFGILIFITSFLIAKNYPQHIQIGHKFTLTYIHLPMTVVLPVIAVLVYYLRSSIQMRKFKP